MITYKDYKIELKNIWNKDVFVIEHTKYIDKELNGTVYKTLKQAKNMIDKQGAE